MIKRLATAGILFALAACATTENYGSLSASDGAAICEMASAAQWGPFGNVDLEVSREKQKQFEEWAKAEDFHPISQSLRCPGGYVPNRKGSPSRYSSSYWISDDRAYAAIRGGFHGGELMGGGGTCYFKATGDGWMRVACFNEWSI